MIEEATETMGLSCESKEASEGRVPEPSFGDWVTVIESRVLYRQRNGTEEYQGDLETRGLTQDGQIMTHRLYLICLFL